MCVPLALLAAGGLPVGGVAEPVPLGMGIAASRVTEPSKPVVSQQQSPTPAVAVSLSSNDEVGIGTKLLWYLPNRCMDLLDIFRLRMRVGPGLAANLRVTDYGAFYWGRYNSVYLGLPGPRNEQTIRWPVGYEQLNGIVMGGVDATDDTRHGPDYGPFEVNFGAHLALVGVDAGVEPLEIGDFLFGLFMVDLEDDDYPRRNKAELKMTSGISRSSQRGMWAVDEKPASFGDNHARLDYLHTNVQHRVSRPVRTVDEYFAVEGVERKPVPDSRMRFGIYTEFVREQGVEMAFQPEVEIEVAFPNVENRLNVFVQSSQADDLPGSTLSERDNNGLTVGVRQNLKKYAISGDIGVRATWPPRAYARVTWHPTYNLEQWSIRPQQRFFADTRDKLGSLTTLKVDRWLGEKRNYFIGSVSSAKYTTKNEDVRWEQTLRAGRVRELMDEDRLYEFERQDVASGGDVSFGVFGTDEVLDTYRLTVGMRRPFYQRWIFWDVEPGIEWDVENDYQAAFRITVGVDMMFWGTASK
jgi:hypothetical protein